MQNIPSMAGLEPAIHVATGKMDGRVKPAHDKVAV